MEYSEHLSRKHVFMVLIASFALLFLAVSLSLASLEEKNQVLKAFGLTEEAVTYLQYFGYLKENETNRLRLSQAVRAFQRMKNLTVTGKLSSRDKSLMSRPRCGNMDTGWLQPPGNLRGQRIRRSPRWEGTKLTKDLLTYRFENYGRRCSREQVEKAIALAFRKWSLVVKLDFFHLRNSNEADITIRFVDHRDNCFMVNRRPKIIDLAHAFTPPATRGDNQSQEIHFRDRADWNCEGFSGFSLPANAIHEIGHVIGVAHNSGLSLMNSDLIGRYQELQAIDIKSARALYPATGILKRFHLISFKTFHRNLMRQYLRVPSKKSLEDCASYVHNNKYDIANYDACEKSCSVFYDPKTSKHKQGLEITLYGSTGSVINNRNIAGSILSFTTITEFTRYWIVEKLCDTILVTTRSSGKREFFCQRYVFNQCKTILLRTQDNLITKNPLSID